MRSSRAGSPIAESRRVYGKRNSAKNHRPGAGRGPPRGDFPPINTLLYVQDKDREVAVRSASTSAGAVRCIALEATEGLSRGLPVRSTGSPITVPVGPGMLGRT